MTKIEAFEYAMQMEMDGKKYYLEQAKAMPEPALTRIFEELANDEDRHYQIFRAMKEGKKGDFAEAFKTNILSSTKNVFQKLQAEKRTIDDFPAGVKEAWVKAREIEEKSENFYRAQADQAESDQQMQIWNLIADEEHKHWVAMDNVVSFIDRPNQWLEDAEWSNLEPY